MCPNSNLQSGANPNKDIAVESKAINMDRKYIFYIECGYESSFPYNFGNDF